MAESLLVKDANGSVRSLQVDSGSSGYITNHTLVSTVSNTTLKTYVPNPETDEMGWDWTTDSGSFRVSSQNQNRKGLIIHNDSRFGKCYVAVGKNSYADLENYLDKPKTYSFLLEGGATYFADTLTCALPHAVYIPSSSTTSDLSTMTLSVTEIY